MEGSRGIRSTAGPALRRAGRVLPRPLREALWTAFVKNRPRPRWGNLKRTTPFSTVWGGDRGLPADRPYIEEFLAAHATDVRGRALEIEGAQYVDRYGGDRVEAADILDIDPANAAATIVGDLADPATLAEGAYDCFVLTQTVHLIPDAAAAVANAYRCLRPGGVVLLTVPALARIQRSGQDYWRYTPRGLEELLARCLPAGAERAVTGYGNLLVAVAFLYGLAAEELGAAEYARHDPFYPVVVAARIRKPAATA